jgi:hypothetical protein
MPHRRAIEEEQPGGEEAGEVAAPASAGLDILNLQRSAGNAAVSRAIAARQPAGTQARTPEEELEKAFFDDDWDRIVVLAKDGAGPLGVKRVAELSADELRYLDDALLRADEEDSWLAARVKAAFTAKGVAGKQQELGAGYGKVEYENTFIDDGDRTSRPRKRARYGFEIKFTPAPWTMGAADEIGFIQSVRVADLDTGENRAANGKDRLASDLWHVDRLEGKDQGWYGMSDEGGSTDKKMSLWQKSDWDEPAWMKDVPSRTRGNVEFHAETAIVCRKGFHAGKVYAMVSWGFEIDKDLVVTPYETEVYNKETEAFRDAVDAWNRQVAGPEAKRSGENQQPLPTNFR